MNNGNELVGNIGNKQTSQDYGVEGIPNEK
jgi:hypothetical protein